jgi:hypothetical protein
MAGIPGQNGTDLQTLLVTLQQTNQQLGNIAQRIANSLALASLASTTSAAALGIYANDAAAAAAGVQLHCLYLNSTTFAVTARHV